MQGVTILKSTPIVKTARLLQLCGMFDLNITTHSQETWTPRLNLPEKWNVGLIVGPSGCGKSTIANELWPDNIALAHEWDENKSIVDSFPSSMKIRDIAELLSSVGFSSPPSWLKPFRVLSTGEKFRVTMARTLAESKSLTVVDEFTSVVDRTVAQVGSAAIAKTIRRRNQQLIAVTCHDDVAEWLQPDWIYMPATNKLARGDLQRPKINLVVHRVHSSTWELFRKHHYLNTSIHSSAQCYVAFWEQRPVAFASCMFFPHPRTRMWREHRTVCLPDFQGVGIGNALSDYVASLYKQKDRYVSITSHPGMINTRLKSSNWKCIAKPNASTKTWPSSKHGIKNVSSQSGGLAMRFRATFEYIGPIVKTAFPTLDIFKESNK